MSVPNFVKIRSIGCEDVKIFQFYKMAAATILDIQICEMLLADGVCMDLQTASAIKISRIRQFKMVAADILKKTKNLITFTTD